MLRIDRKERKLTALIEPKLQEAGIAERYDLQRMILSSAGIFFNEIKEPLLLIGEEIQPSDLVSDRIDLLAIDKSGEIVVIELKRGHEKLQMMQAISYAAMVSDWKPADFVQQLAEFQQISPDDASLRIEEFLDEGNTELLNKSQRIVLCAEEFDYALLMSARWLSQQYGLGIRCYRVSLAADQEVEYLACTRVFPPPELEENARRIRQQLSTGRTNVPTDWEEIISEMTNPDLASFFRDQLAQGRQNYLYHRFLTFYNNSVRTFTVSATRQYGRVVQRKRFDGDIEFWRTRLSDKGNIEPVRDGRELRFYLKTKSDIDAFLKVYEEFKTNTPVFKSMGNDCDTDNSGE